MRKLVGVFLFDITAGELLRTNKEGEYEYDIKVFFHMLKYCDII